MKNLDNTTSFNLKDATEKSLFFFLVWIEFQQSFKNIMFKRLRDTNIKPTEVLEDFDTDLREELYNVHKAFVDSGKNGLGSYVRTMACNKVAGLRKKDFRAKDALKGHKDLIENDAGIGGARWNEKTLITCAPGFDNPEVFTRGGKRDDELDPADFPHLAFDLRHLSGEDKKMINYRYRDKLKDAEIGKKLGGLCRGSVNRKFKHIIEKISNATKH